MCSIQMLRQTTKRKMNQNVQKLITVMVPKPLRKRLVIVKEQRILQKMERYPRRHAVETLANLNKREIQTMQSPIKTTNITEFSIRFN